MNSKVLVAEFIGTFTLIYAGVGAIAANDVSGGALGLTGIALAHGLAIAVMVTATAAISGGHLNPAVSFGMALVGRITPATMVQYWAAQCLGAIAAAGCVRLTYAASTLSTIKLGTPMPGAGVGTAQVLVAEIITTFFLVFVVFGSAVDRRAPKLGGLFIGLTVALDILAIGPVSGAAMNPARHLGPALLGGGLSHTWLYWLGPLVGGGLAAVVYAKVLEER
ncbi:MAG TPA: MIP family channel protein [Candidatus Bathyarchaeia archaeon]|jgi:aquaporin Z|nr:MIP family channel protein [Candidatus Bathyarchaeia archaeon]